MTGRLWYIAIDGKQGGPYPEEQVRSFIAKGSIDHNTLVWTDGMSAWERAGHVPGLIPSAAPPVTAPPGPPGLRAQPLNDVYAPQGRDPYAAQGRLDAEFGVWSLLGHYLLFIIGMMVVIPSPWTSTGFYRWLVAHLRVPGRPNLAFEGKPGDIWYIFILIPISLFVPFAGIFISMFFSLLAFRWMIRNISSEGRLLPLSFTGGYWGFLGWYIFLAISFISIIGWAWVLAAWMRWFCRNIAGSTRPISFTGSGWQILWRSIVLEFGCAFVIPIPWMLRWYARWWVSQIAVG